MAFDALPDPYVELAAVRPLSPPRDVHEPVLLTRQEAALRAGVPDRTISRWRYNEPDFPYVLTGKSDWRVHREKLDIWLAKRAEHSQDRPRQLPMPDLHVDHVPRKRGRPRKSPPPSV